MTVVQLPSLLALVEALDGVLDLEAEPAMMASAFSARMASADLAGVLGSLALPLPDVPASLAAVLADGVPAAVAAALGGFCCC